jgi:hypothetical protein
MSSLRPRPSFYLIASLNYKMKKMSFLILLLIQLYSYRSFACECLQNGWSVERVKANIKHSDLIFIGNRISYSQEYPTIGEYSFKVIEVFKGNINEGDIVSGKTFGCSTSPYVKGLWIVYATQKKGGLIDMDGCGLSKSLSEPEVPLPPPDSFDKELQERKFEAFPAFLREWHNEYILLQNFKSRTLTNEGIVKKDNTTLVYIAIILALAALAVSLWKK